MEDDLASDASRAEGPVAAAGALAGSAALPRIAPPTARGTTLAGRLMCGGVCVLDAECGEPELVSLFSSVVVDARCTPSPAATTEPRDDDDCRSSNGTSSDCGWVGVVTTTSELESIPGSLKRDRDRDIERSDKRGREKRREGEGKR